VAGPTVWNSPGQSPRSRCYYRQLQALVENVFVFSVPEQLAHVLRWRAFTFYLFTFTYLIAAVRTRLALQHLACHIVDWYDCCLTTIQVQLQGRHVGSRCRRLHPAHRTTAISQVIPLVSFVLFFISTTPERRGNMTVTVHLFILACSTYIKNPSVSRSPS